MKKTIISILLGFLVAHSVPDETNIPVVSPSGIEVRIVGPEAEKWLEEMFPVRREL